MSAELGEAYAFAGAYIVFIIGMIVMVIQERNFNKKNTDKTE